MKKNLVPRSGRDRTALAGVLRNYGVFSFVLFMALATPAHADEKLELKEWVGIERATAFPASVGACTEIRFEITNQSDQNIHLLGLEVGFASSARLIARIDANRTVTMDSITIPAWETLDLTTSHLVFEVCGINETLRLDEEFEITLNFVSWKRTVPIHIHGQPNL